MGRQQTPCSVKELQKAQPQKVLFVDRDGTILEEPEDFQVDAFEKMRFVEGAIPALRALKRAGYRLVMVSNQDGLGTPAFPRETYEGPQRLMEQVLESAGAGLDEILVCPHFPADHCSCRKPQTGLFKAWLELGRLDAANAYVVGDRLTDMALAQNLGVVGFRVGPEGQSWEAITRAILGSPATLDRYARVERKTRETAITVEVWLDRRGENQIETGVGFFDHMLDQIAVHGGIRLHLSAKGDLEVDDHHTVEDVGLALGEALRQALGDKRGIRRFGFLLPMDEAQCRCALDISGRPWLSFKAEFKNAKVGDLSTEMVEHFFRSLAMSMGITLHLKAKGKNDHHVAESLFKAFGRSLRDAVRVEDADLPSSKGVL